MVSRLKEFPFVPGGLLVVILARLAIWGATWLSAAAALLAAGWFAFDLVRWLMKGRVVVTLRHHRASDSTPRSESPLSLVFFLSEPRFPEEETIRSCVSHALGLDFDPDSPDAEQFVVEVEPTGEEGDRRDRSNPFESTRQFFVQLPQGLYTVISSCVPYVSDPAAFARESIRDKRLRQAVENHRAWISVDCLENDEETVSRERAYETMGRLLASMAGPDCLALFSPELQRCNEFDPTLLDELSGPDPLRIFDGPTFEPIIEIAENDPRMRAAIDEAIRRWPEFVAAFHERSDDEADRFIVKAEFREGNKAEFMWVAVTEIERDLVRGILTNDPLELLDVHRGAEVTVDLEQLNDWIYPTPDGSIAGGFTLDVLAGDE